MFTTILIATDGSDHARKAARLAADLAKLYDCRLIACHTVTNRAITEKEQRLFEVEYGSEAFADIDVGQLMEARGDARTWVPLLVDQYNDLLARVRTTIGERLIKDVRKIAKEAGVSNVSGQLLFGEPAREILKFADKKNADAIVLGSRGLGNVAGLLKGSVSRQVARDAKVTCMTVK